MDWTTLLPALDKIGTVALILILGFGIATGRLVTRREADNIRAYRDTWREVALREQEARMKQDALLSKHTEQGTTIVAMLESIRREADRRR